MMTTPPAPLEWHPAYRGQTWLLDWIEGRGERRADIVKVQILKPIRLQDYDREPDVTDILSTRTLTKRKARGLAPYVGRPFIYRWYFAADELGRAVAGDVQIIYGDPDALFLYGPFEYAPDARNGHDPDTPVWP